MRTLMFAALLGCLMACSQTVHAETANATCPMMGGNVDPEGGTVEWEGQTIGFCCDGCSGKFEALSAEEKVAHLIDQGGMDLPVK